MEKDKGLTMDCELVSPEQSEIEERGTGYHIK